MVVFYVSGRSGLEKI